jgi:hypothetical protein
MAGVYLPTVQNIMGVILFLRLPWITGQAGILQTLGVVACSVLTTILTSLSMSAIAVSHRARERACVLRRFLADQRPDPSGGALLRRES